MEVWEDWREGEHGQGRTSQGAELEEARIVTK